MEVWGHEGVRGQRFTFRVSEWMLGDKYCETDDGTASEVDDVVNGDHL